MEIKLTGEAMGELVHKGILDALGPEGQAAVLKEVVSYLTTQTKIDSAYGHSRVNPSPLMRAMHSAAEDAARKYIALKLETDPEFLRQIESTYADALGKIFVDNKAETVGKLADALVEALRPKY